MKIEKKSQETVRDVVKQVVVQEKEVVKISQVTLDEKEGLVLRAVGNLWMQTGGSVDEGKLVDYIVSRRHDGWLPYGPFKGLERGDIAQIVSHVMAELNNVWD